MFVIYEVAFVKGDAGVIHTELITDEPNEVAAVLTAQAKVDEILDYTFAFVVDRCDTTP